MVRDEALEILHTNMQNQNLRRHCYAVEAVMKALARHFGEDEEKWGIVGLLHDGDYEKTKETPEKHTILMNEWLKAAGETDEEILHAILTHNFAHTGQTPPNTRLEWALYCGDELTGLIVAATLVHPDKKLKSIDADFVLRRFAEPAFARGALRERIAFCQEKLGIPLPEFVKITLEAMQEIAADLGL